MFKLYCCKKILLIQTILNGHQWREIHFVYLTPNKKKVYALYSCIVVMRKYFSLPAFQSHFMSYNFQQKSLCFYYTSPMLICVIFVVILSVQSDSFIF